MSSTPRGFATLHDDADRTQDRPWRSTRPVRLKDLSNLTPLVRAAALPDPRELYDELARRWGEVAPVELEPGVPAWLVTGQRPVYVIMRNEHVFSPNPQTWNGHARGGLPATSGLREPLDDVLERLPESLTAARTRLICHLLIGRLGHGPSDPRRRCHLGPDPVEPPARRPPGHLPAPGRVGLVTGTLGSAARIGEVRR